jgi:carboxyl-terminal processing protease
MPDIFVPLDTTEYSPVIARLYRHNTLSDFAYRFYVNHKTSLDRFASAESFAGQYKGDDTLWTDLARFAARDSIQLQYLPVKDRRMLLLRTKSMLAHQVWHMEGFYIVYNQDDAMIARAREVLK